MQNKLTPFLTLLAVLLLSPLVQAQEESSGEKKKEDKPKTIAELTEKSERSDGLFTLFRDNKTGELRMLIKADQIDKEFIYFSQASNGVVQTGWFTGAYAGNGIISIRRHYDRVELVAENFAFYFDPNNPLSKASDANISDAVLAVEKIVAEDEESGDLLISANKIFLGESLFQIKYPLSDDADAKTTPVLGGLDKDKSKILGSRVYPENIDIEVEYVYHSAAPKVSFGADVTDSRNVSIKVLHSLIAMPEEEYTPRYADPRIGTFDVQVTDLTSTSPTPYRDLITRWKLVKKNPEQEISDPVEPITWWIENTTPLEWRELIKQAALKWNSSFETAGFSNAMVVKVQPDDADWDAGDIRYNVLRWTSSPQPPFSGYGPSFTNPRTGQLLGADIMLEASTFSYRAGREWLLGNTSTALTSNLATPGRFCAHGQGLKHGAILGRALARYTSASSNLGHELEAQIQSDIMEELILHELGHTLGMNHNMKATNLLSPEDMFNPEVVAKKGFSGSVMDYANLNFPPRGEQATMFYQNIPGYYDDWYIEFAYSPGLDDPELMEQHLAQSSNPRLVFGNDADMIYSPTSGMDPTVQAYDLSNDPIAYAEGRVGLVRDALSEVNPGMIESGESYQDIFDGISSMLREWRISAVLVSRYVGGVLVDRSVAGQEGGKAPFRPVSEDRQREAMEFLNEQVFAPDAMNIDAELLSHAAVQRRGFNHFGTTEDPKIHDAILATHKAVLDQLLNASVLKRVTDSGLYGNTYSLSEVFTDLTSAVFEADAGGNVSSHRQNLQMEYVRRLAAIAATAEKPGAYHSSAVSMAIYNLGEIRELVDNKRRPDIATRAHVQNLNLVIERALAIK